MLTEDDRQTQQVIKIQNKVHEAYSEMSEAVNIYRLIILKHCSLGKTSFKDLKFLTTCTDGNLAAHLRGLEQNGLIDVIKEFEGRRPKTSYLLTLKGKKVFDMLQTNLKALLSIRGFNE